MTDNMKKFFETASQDKEYMEKLAKAETPEAIVALAAEKGFPLTLEDLKPAEAEKVSDDELEAVAGGKDCYCALGGGGVEGGSDLVCACVMMGAGFGYRKIDVKGKDYGKVIEVQRCICPIGGHGESLTEIK